MIIRLIIQSFLFALVFAFIIPKIHGAYFHGNYGKGLEFGFMLGAIHALTTWTIRLIVYLLDLDGGDVPLEAMIVIMVLLGCVIVPTLELRLLAVMFPATLGFAGWGAAIKSVLLMIVITLFTRDRGEQ